MSTTAVTLAAICCLALAPLRATAAQRSRGTPTDPRFRTGLTATVVASPAVGGHGCRRVTLRWSARPGATAYRAQVATARDGARTGWTALPATSACGAGRELDRTGLIDVQPEPPTGSTRRLYYRVVAVGPAGPVDSTDVVPVDLVAAPAPSAAGRP